MRNGLFLDRRRPFVPRFAYGAADAFVQSSEYVLFVCHFSEADGAANLFHRRRGSRSGALCAIYKNVLQRVWIFHVVTCLWLFFRLGTGGLGLQGAGEVFGAFARTSVPACLFTWTTAAVLAAGFLCQLADAHRPRALWNAFNRLPAAAQGAIAAALLVAILGLGPTGVPAFIYFQF